MTDKLFPHSVQLWRHMSDGTVFSRAVLQEKLLRLGAWNIVWWQQRFLYAEPGGICHTSLTNEGQPCGRHIFISLHSISAIDVAPFPQEGSEKTEVRERMTNA